jgi:hypothetical protein
LEAINADYDVGLHVGSICERGFTAVIKTGDRH